MILFLISFLLADARAAAVTQPITLDSGFVINYHVLVDDKVLVVPDQVNATGTPVPGPVVVFVKSYSDQTAYNAGKKPYKEVGIKISKSAIKTAQTAYWNAILSELSTNKSTYLEQIK